MARITGCLMGSSVFCALVLPALGTPPSPAPVASQTGSGSHASISLAGGSPGHVIVVDDNGSGPYFQIQDAVDAAQDGDTVLVKHGNYGGFTVVDKALVIVGDGTSVFLTGAVEADDLGHGKVLSLVHLRVTGPVGATALTLANDDGHVRADHCMFIGADGVDSITLNGGDGAVLDRCADVAFSHCTIRGGRGRPGMGLSGRGISAQSCVLAIHESIVAGGSGYDGGGGSYDDAGSGNDACDFFQSTLYAEASSFTGGDGGTAGFTHCLGAMGGYAGCALATETFGNESIARLVANTEAAGTPGCSQGPLCSTDCSFPQQPPTRIGGPFVDLGIWPTFQSISTPVREGNTVSITVKGLQNDAVYLLRSATTRELYLPGTQSMSFVRPSRPEDVVFLGTLTVDYVPTTFSFELQDLGPGVESQAIHLQVMLVGPSAPPRLSGASSLVVLDSAY